MHLYDVHSFSPPTQYMAYGLSITCTANTEVFMTSTHNSLTKVWLLKTTQHHCKTAVWVVYCTLLNILLWWSMEWLQPKNKLFINKQQSTFGRNKSLYYSFLSWLLHHQILQLETLWLFLNNQPSQFSQKSTRIEQLTDQLKQKERSNITQQSTMN